MDLVATLLVVIQSLSISAHGYIDLVHPHGRVAGEVLFVDMWHFSPVPKSEAIEKHGVVQAA